MQPELECDGRVRVGAVSPATADRLARVGGEWLEFSPEDGALVVRHVQPGGSPALSAVPSELIAILDSLPADVRDSMPGGTLHVRDRSGVVMRLVVESGEIRIQWPRGDWDHAVPVDVDSMLRSADPFSSKVSGWVRFGGPEASGRALVDFVDRFEGLYPEGDLEVRPEGSFIRAELDGVNVGPAQLLGRLRELADPADSLEADLDVGSFAPHSMDRDFRLTIRAGKAEAVRPSIWREK